jgi:HD superfamily phosphohydrolase
MSKAIDALLSGFTEPRRDTLWGHIYLTPALEAVSESETFVKLHRIAQLGPAYLCYPGATHTRAAHSFGVYYLTRRLLLHLAEEGADEYMTEEGVMAMLCAALLHDCGHFPYTHSLKELPLLEHETLSARTIVSEPLKSLIAKTGADPAMCAAIIDLHPAGALNEELAVYRQILSGVLDPDKLDYLNRDAHYCGIPYGTQDVDYIISMMHPHKTRGIEIDARGIPSVESLLFSKYLMYRNVYWHHRVRCATAMIKKAIHSGLKDGILDEEELYNLDDRGLFTVLDSRRHPAFALADNVRQGRLFMLEKEFRYDETAHSGWENLEKRGELEAEFAHELSRRKGRTIHAGQVLFDLPERVVFDTGLLVQGEGRDFCESSGVFSPEIIESFTRTIRVARVYIEPVAKLD